MAQPKPNKQNILILASGAGSNAAALMDYFADYGSARVAEVITNNPLAGVVDEAARRGIPVRVVAPEDLAAPEFLDSLTGEAQPALVVLAGFLKKIPPAFIAAFPDRIINLHPALLPAYGGPGMYGQRVHEAVLAAGDRESGITIHRVNEHYDEGTILLQARCPVLPTDTPKTLAIRIRKLEHFYLPRVVEFLMHGS